MPPIDTVIFDLGEVLIPWNPRRLYRKLFADEAAMERFLSEVCTPQWNLQQDGGRSLAEGTAERIAAFPSFEDLIRAYYERWDEMLGTPDEESLRLLSELKTGGYRVLALSNWSAETFAQTRPRYPFLEEFEGIVISGVEKLVKPDPAIFRLLCARYAVAPERAVFLDDNSENLQGALAIGMRALHFRSPSQVRAALAAMGVSFSR